MKNEDIMFDLVKEVREEQKEIRSDLHQQSLAFSDHLVTDAKMYEQISQINKTLEVNTRSLQEHMQQTLLVREQTEILKQMYQKLDERLDAVVRPKSFKEVMSKIAKYCGWISAIAGAIYGIVNLLK